MLLFLVESKQLSVNSIECALCKYVVSYIDNIIQNNKSEAAIEAALDKVCSIVPHAVKAECDQFVKNYGPLLVQLIEQYTTPDEVCQALKLCTQNTKEIPPGMSYILIIFSLNFIVFIYLVETEKSIDNPVECSICKYVVGYVDAVIQTNKSEAAIDAALEKVCTILPHSLNRTCYQFVDAYGPVLVELIAKYATADEVCDALKLCNNGTVISRTFLFLNIFFNKLI